MRLLTISEAAQRLGLKTSTLRFWIWTRKIDVVRIGRAVRIKDTTLDALIVDGTTPASMKDR
jgi:excisionase family DNA binding protein